MFATSLNMLQLLPLLADSDSRNAFREQVIVTRSRAVHERGASARAESGELSTEPSSA